MNIDKNKAATKPRFRRTRIIIQIAPLLIPLIFLVWRINLSSQVDAKLKALKQTGHPTTPAELQQLYYAPIAKESNAANFFDRAIELSSLTNAATIKLLDEMSKHGRFLTSTQLFSAEHHEKLTQLLDENREALKLLHQTPTGKKCRYDLDFEMGFDMLLPHLQPLGRAGQLLCLQAIVHAEQNQMDAAVDDFNAAFRVLDSLADDPILITHLIRMKNRKDIYNAMERILGRRTFTEAQLLELSEAIHKREYPGSLTRALEAELCVSGHYFQKPFSEVIATADRNLQPDKPTAKNQVGPIVNVLMKWSGFTPRDYRFFLDIMTKRIALSTIPFPERLAPEDELARRVEQEPGSYLYVMSGFMLPGLNNVNAKEANDLARTKMTQIALAIERYRLAHQNKLPDQLDNLIPLLPSLPVDPYTGKNFQYKKLSSGYLLYSVGRNLKDDGGVEKTTKQTDGPDDVAFAVEQ